MSRLRVALGVVCSLVWACGSMEQPDAGQPVVDAGPRLDAGPRPDAGPLPDAGGDDDAGTPDAGEADAGVDAGLPRLPDGGLAPLVIPRQLSQLHLFKDVPIVAGQVQPEDDLLPYSLSTALFSDFALKARSIRMPEGSAVYSEQEVMEFPVGTIITKTFSFPADLRQPDSGVRVIETRLLVRQPSGWEAYPFVWNAEQTEATWAPGGRVVDVAFVGLDGGDVATRYLVPSRNQCIECHHLNADAGQELLPIGPKARYLNHDGQLQHWATLGKLSGLPAEAALPRAIDAFDPDAGTLEERARTYLDINCAHCHRPNGTAGDTSQLWLNWQNQDRFHLGECKRPGSAGNDVGGQFDLVPGSHDASILWFRMQTTESGKMMPAIGRSLRHDQGAELIQAWIDAMPPRSCN